MGGKREIRTYEADEAYNHGGVMTDRCTCATNPNEHEHRYLRPVTVAALIGRPIATVETWRKREVIPQTGERYGERKVCVCCAAELSEKTPVRWVKRARRRRLTAPRRLVA